MDTAWGIVDIHSHLLPGVDDGAQTPEEALDLARAAVADGVEHLVLTPHVFPGRFDNTRSTIEAGFSRFVNLLRVYNIPLKLAFAGEVRLDASTLDLLAAGELPFLGTVEGYRTMLLELPDAQIPLGTDKLILHLVRQSIRPIIVHPERNKAVMEKPERMGLFVDMGCFLQLTGGSLLGQFGPRALSASRYLLEQEWVTAVASDAHNLGARTFRLSEARAYLCAEYGEAAARRLLRDGPKALCGMAAQCSVAA
jgi:protein-tyrosine phosphatase